MKIKVVHKYSTWANVSQCMSIQETFTNCLLISLGLFAILQQSHFDRKVNLPHNIYPLWDVYTTPYTISKLLQS